MVGGEAGSEMSRVLGVLHDRGLCCCWVQEASGPTCVPWLFGSGTKPIDTTE